MKNNIFIFCSVILFLLGSIFYCSTSEGEKETSNVNSKSNDQMEEQLSSTSKGGGMVPDLIEVRNQVYLGNLSNNEPMDMKNPSEYCLEDGYLYKSTNYSLGEIFLYYSDEDELGQYMDKEQWIILAYGELKTDLTNIIVKTEPCPSDYDSSQQPMMQMRSDWVGEETGFNLGHSSMERLQNVTYFEADSTIPYDGIYKESNDDTYRLVFTNLFNQTIDELTISGHYEGIMGKPVPHYIDKNFSDIEPTETIEVKFDKEITEDREYTFYNVIISSQDDQIIIDISY